MDLPANNSTLGFLAGVCFMAALVITLTVFYFNAPRPGVQVRTDKEEIPLKNAALPSKRRFPGRGFSIPKLKFWSKPKALSRPTEGLNKENPVKNEADTKQKARQFVASINTEARESKPQAERQPVIPSKLKIEATGANQNTESPAVKEKKKETNLTAAIPPNPKIDGSHGVQSNGGPGPAQTNPVPVAQSSGTATEESGTGKTVESAAKTPDTPGSSVSPPAKMSNEITGRTEVDKKAQAKDPKADTNAAPVVPPVQAVNEKPASSDPGEKPKPADSSSDFSGLFTDGDIEENEAEILAKELNEIDTDDILQESLDLISQFKSNRT
jgi:hypothetical protein